MTAVDKIYKYAEPNLSILGWMGFLGFPSYYYIWAYLFPQPYENLGFRLICSLALLVLALRRFIPNYLKKYLPHYYLWCIALCLPFFFSFMLVMNDWSSVWVMSFMASIFLHVLLVHEPKILLFQCVVSVISGFALSYFVSGELDIHEIDWSYVPVFVFTYTFGNLFYFRNQMEHEARISLAKSFGASIAHEMRNPLSALKTTVDLLKGTLSQSTITNGTVDKKDRELMNEMLSDANSIIKNGNEAIDLLLTSIDQNRVSRSTFVKHSLIDVVTDAVSSYPYKSIDAKQAVKANIQSDFDYFGSDILLKYVVYNLFKNAFHYQVGEAFTISLEVENEERFNYLKIRDTGAGIESEKIDSIFQDFYTFGKNGSFGLGLPFCRRVMHSFGGEIECISKEGEWTEFVLRFPKYDSSSVNNIKFELMRNKSILLINTEFPVTKSLNENSFYMGYRLESLSMKEALKLEEFQFEYDLILLDLDTIDELSLHKLEANLCFTEARIVYLYGVDKEYYTNFNRYLNCCAINKREVIESCTDAIDKLMFSDSYSGKSDIPKKQQDHDRTVLLVDDNESVRSLTSILLSQQGFDVVEAKDGSEVLGLVTTRSIDVIIMDIDMPLMDGYQATAQIRNSGNGRSSIPIIGHTGDNSKESIDQMKQVGMNDYIIKPATSDTLIEKLEHYL
ncbi:hybrid sensor histidine kinase/response regulator [uncultured Vibrio sp.]|uniref:ATP-binding response regulator n=1 Tax=uncultured Vibrio sp. TaxID=114054 RepID=UPI0025D6DB9E|nr:hybrid sensor histidine kinase/response regulator [uncultured Vibrio sp.]